MEASLSPASFLCGGAAARLARFFRLAYLGKSLNQERRCRVCCTVFTPAASSENAILCPACHAALPRREKGVCPLCGEAAAWPDLPVARCGRCMSTPPPWTNFICHGPHEGLLRTLLIRLKFGRQVHLGAVLGQLLARHPALPALMPDCVTPVPLHTKRLVERGYNQALLVAQPVANALQLPLDAHLLVRAKATVAQTASRREARLSNVRGAFTALPKAAGKHILLVDDTMTTGATLGEAARCLMAAGASCISVAVISRTPSCRK